MSAPSGHSPDEVPPSIGRYRIQARVSSDAKDDVYAGFDPMIERPVAIKVFRLTVSDLAATATIKRTFYAEMQRIGVLIHPNIVTLYDAGELPGALFTASEFVEGASLAERLEASAALELPMRVSLLLQMADALEYARGLGTVHLNLKPGSVYIASDGTLKLGGFGVTPVLDAMAAVSRDARSSSRYTAPERREGQTGDARSDVYSFAEIALDMLAGAEHLTDEPPSVPPLPRYLAEQNVDADRWQAVFRRALAPNPADRYDSVLTLKFELVLLLGVNESEAHGSWETARALGQLGAITGEPTMRLPSDDAMTTMMATRRQAVVSHTHAAGVRLPADEVDTGQMETVLSQSGDQITGPLAASRVESPEAETTAIRTPRPFPKDVATSEEETRPAHIRPPRDK